MLVDRDALERIHARMLAGDVTASSDLFVAVHVALAAAIRKSVGRVISWDDAGDKATDAIVEYLRNPGKFDGSRGGLFGYLLLIARGDALNLMRDAGRKKKNLARLVELSATDGKSMQETLDVTLDADRILREHRAEVIRDQGDEAVLRLYLQGEKETRAYAEALGIAALTAVEQMKAVKLRKDRIEQRLRRLREVLK